MLCLWLLFALKTRKTEPDHEKNLFIGVSEQVVLKLKHAQLHIKLQARTIIKSVDRGSSIKEMFRKLFNQNQSSALSKR